VDRVRVLVRVHQGDDDGVVDLSQEGNLVPQPVLAPDVAIGDGLDSTEVGGGELDAGALALFATGEGGSSANRRFMLLGVVV
jgi:hypothetical protein